MNNGQKCGILIGAVLIILMSLFGLSILWNKGSILAEERYAYDREGTQKSVFASNGEVAYLCCCKEEKFYLYYVDNMGFRKLPYFCSGNERIIRMDVDDSGQCSLLIYSSENELVDGYLLSTITDADARIDVIDSYGNIVKRYDGSFFLSSTNIPSSFITHDSMIYAMNCDGEATIVNMATGSVDKLPAEGMVSAVDVLDNRVVLTYYSNDSSYYQELSLDGKIQKKIKLPKSNCKYGICKIAGDDVYLYNKDEGVFKCRSSSNKFKRIEKSQKNEKGIGFGKNKICMIAEENEEYIFRFLTLNS